MSMQPAPTLWARARTSTKAGTRGYCDKVGEGGSDNKISYAVAANYFCIPGPICSPPLVIPASSPRVVIPPPRIAPTYLPPEDLPPSDTAISDIGARLIYLTPKALCANINPKAPKVLVGTSGGPLHQSLASCNLLHTNLPVTSGNIIPQFYHNLMGIRPLYDHGCRVVFEKKSVTVYLWDDDVLLRGWRDPKGAKLWRFALRPKGHTSLPGDYSTGPKAINAHNLPSVAAPVCYLHACAGFPVQSTWLAAMKAGNFAS